MGSLGRRIVGAVVLGLASALGSSGCQDRTVEVSLDAAIKAQDVKMGTGYAAQEGNLVEVHYVGRLADGKIIVDTRSNRRSHRFVIGDGSVIPGMDAAVRGMRAGGVRRVTLPPHAHYGRQGYAGVVPEESTMIFEIEMVRVTKSGGNPTAWSSARGP